MVDRFLKPPTCPYCEGQVPWKELPNHLKTVHPEIVAAGEHWSKDTRHVWIRAAIPATLVWIASLILIVLTHPEFILAEIGAAYLVFMGTYLYARHATRSDFEAVRDLPHFCRICDSALPGRDLKAHIHEAHPAVTRLQRATDAYLLLTGVLVVVLLGYLVATLLAMGARFYGGSGKGIAGLGIVSWFGLAALWMRFVYSPRLQRARDQWQKEHPWSRDVRR
jgi:uncharacterized oligopeptide transporter (OPT) family protein